MTTSSEAPKATILVMDDEKGVRDSVFDTLTDEGYRVLAVATPESAAHYIDEADLVFTDGFDDGRNETGQEVLRLVRDTRGIDVPVILMSGDVTDSPLRLGASGFNATLGKPPGPGKLLELVQEAVERSKKSAVQRGV